MSMTRSEYQKARKLCRQNGRYALQWLPEQQAAAMQAVTFAPPADLLAERQYCYDTMNWSIHLAKSIARHHSAVRHAADLGT